MDYNQFPKLFDLPKLNFPYFRPQYVHLPYARIHYVFIKNIKYNYSY